jgi:hypothetical protein
MPTFPSFQALIKFWYLNTEGKPKGFVKKSMLVRKDDTKDQITGTSTIRL